MHVQLLIKNEKNESRASQHNARIEEFSLKLLRDGNENFYVILSKRHHRGER